MTPTIYFDEPAALPSTDDPQPLPNMPLLRKVLADVDANPAAWNQTAYCLVELGAAGELCATAFCIAGHAAFIEYGVREVEGPPTCDWPLGKALYPANGMTWHEAGRVALGLTVNEAHCLFNGGNDRAAVQYWAEVIAARAGERL